MMSEPSRSDSVTPAAAESASVHTVLRRRLVLVLTAGAVVLAGLVFPFPVDGRLWNSLFDLAHAPVFCALVLVIAGILDPTSIGLPASLVRVAVVRPVEAVFIAGICLGLGLAGEVLQGLAGRSPSVHDVAANAAGAAAAVLWITAVRSGPAFRRILKAAAGGVLLVALIRPAVGIRGALRQRADFPCLASFERSDELDAWEPVDARLQRTDQTATHGTYALQVDLLPGEFSGALMVWPMPDWRGFSWFCCDVQTNGDAAVPLTVKVFDRPHERSGHDPDDRFETTVEVQPGGFQQIRLSLEKIREAPRTRSMRLDQIAGVELFTTEPDRPVRLFVDHVRLE